MRDTCTLLTLLALCALAVQGQALHSGALETTADPTSTAIQSPPQGQIKNRQEQGYIKSIVQYLEEVQSYSDRFFGLVSEPMDNWPEIVCMRQSVATDKFGEEQAKLFDQGSTSTLITLPDESLAHAFWRQYLPIRNTLIHEIVGVAKDLVRAQGEDFQKGVRLAVLRNLYDADAHRTKFYLKNGGGSDTCNSTIRIEPLPLQYESVSDIPQAELNPSGNSVSSELDQSCHVSDGQIRGYIAPLGWNTTQCCSNPGHCAKNTTLYDLPPLSMFRPLWVGSATMCVLVTPAWPSEYELWYTLPHLDSAEKCITDTRLQRRHAAHHLAWTQGGKCVLYQYKRHTREPRAHYVLPRVTQERCCLDGACHSPGATQLAGDKQPTPAVEDIVLVQWLNGNVCAFWSAKNVLGYIKGATRAQCQSVMTSE